MDSPTTQPAVQSTASEAAQQRDPLLKIKLALMRPQTLPHETSGFDPYNARDGSTRKDSWAQRKPR